MTAGIGTMRVGKGEACPLRPDRSYINLFRYCERVVDLDPEVSDRALYLSVNRVRAELRADYPCAGRSKLL